ncbi:hypothetical protein LP416_25260 [Polaromonas sp. P2-4]|nr:hypothetical protein LP416_25260 [Polaromonas sp. P2-4]
MPPGSSALDPAAQVNDWFNSLFPQGATPQPAQTPETEVILAPEPATPPTPAMPPEVVQDPVPQQVPQAGTVFPSPAGLAPGTSTGPRFVLVPARPAIAPERGGGIPILRESGVPENAGNGQ